MHRDKDPEEVSRIVYRMQRPNRSLRFLQKLGFTNNRNIVWSWYEPRNFGDWIGPYLYLAITGQKPLHYPGHNTKSRRARALVTVGSILRHMKTDDVFSVWGSGIISRSDEFARPNSVYAVRGPHSRKRMIDMGYLSSEVFGDPAILMPLVM